MGHEADHTPPCGAKANNVWNNSTIPQYAFTIHNPHDFQYQFFPYQEWHMTVAIRTLAWSVSLQSSSTMIKLMGLGGVKEIQIGSEMEG